LKARAKSIRKGIITSTTIAGSGHPTSSLSGVEIAVALFFGGILRYDPKNPHWPERDRFILSKGHAAPLLYAVLAEAGYFPKDELSTLRKLGSPLEGHPNMRRLAGVEASTGSLGQGLSLGLITAFMSFMATGKWTKGKSGKRLWPPRNSSSIT
jgi:transketolase